MTYAHVPLKYYVGDHQSTNQSHHAMLHVIALALLLRFPLLVAVTCTGMIP